MPESENTETPPVEIPEIAKTPDKAPEISAPDPATYKKKLDQLYWLRIIFAAASGIIATFAFDSIDGEERRWASIIFMIAVYLVTFVIAKSMKMQLPASDKKKIITQAIGSFFLYVAGSGADISGALSGVFAISGISTGGVSVFSDSGIGSDFFFLNFVN